MPLLSDAHEPPLLSGTEVRDPQLATVRRLVEAHAVRREWPRNDLVDVEDMLGLN